MQRVARERQMNVPRPHDPGLAPLTLPPAQRPTGEQRPLDHAPRPLAPAAREPPVEPRRPMRESRDGQPLPPGPQSLAPRRVERRLAEQPLRQRPHVEPGSTDHDRLASVGPDARAPTAGIARGAAPAGAPPP